MNYTVAHYVDQVKLKNAIRRDIENDPVHRFLVCMKKAEREMIADARTRASKLERGGSNMKKIRTASGGLLFLEGEDYMPKLLAYLRETAGYDAAEAVEEWAREENYALKERLVKEMNEVTGLRNRVANLERVINDERDEHIDEITELEEELVRLSEVKDRLMAANEYMTDLINNPEKLFPEIGSKVFRFVDKELSKIERGRIDAYKLRTDSRTRRPEFFVRISWNRAWGNGFVSDPYWYKFKNLGKSFHVGDPTDYVKDAFTAEDAIEGPAE